MFLKFKASDLVVDKQMLGKLKQSKQCQKKEAERSQKRKPQSIFPYSGILEFPINQDNAFVTMLDCTHT